MRARSRLDRILHEEDPEAGVGIMELVVAMIIFTVVVGVFLAGMVTMTKNTVRTDVVTQSGDTVRTVFQRFDHQVRYAEALNYPGTGGSGSVYVEFRVSAQVSATGKAQCTQWRWVPTGGLLQVRRWEDKSNPSIPNFTTVATKVLPMAGSTYPFAVTPATTTEPRQKLILQLRVGSTIANAGADMSSTFVARNSSVKSVSNADENGDGKSDIPICITTSGGRP